jgi:hypothetical protein
MDCHEPGNGTQGPRLRRFLPPFLLCVLDFLNQEPELSCLGDGRDLQLIFFAILFTPLKKDHDVLQNTILRLVLSLNLCRD